MSSPLPTLLFSSTYLIVVSLLCLFMKCINAFHLKFFIFCYNIFSILLNIYISFKIVYLKYKAGDYTLCTTINATGDLYSLEVNPPTLSISHDLIKYSTDEPNNLVVLCEQGHRLFGHSVLCSEKKALQDLFSTHLQSLYHVSTLVVHCGLFCQWHGRRGCSHQLSSPCDHALLLHHVHDWTLVSEMDLVEEIHS